MVMTCILAVVHEKMWVFTLNSLNRVEIRKEHPPEGHWFYRYISTKTTADDRCT
jgi:hypothetical protein